MAVPRSQLLTGQSKCAVGAVPHKDTVIRSCNENLGILHVVNLAHVGVVKHLEVASRAVRDIESLALYGTGLFY